MQPDGDGGAAADAGGGAAAAGGAAETESVAASETPAQGQVVASGRSECGVSVGAAKHAQVRKLNILKKKILHRKGLWASSHLNSP